MAKLRFVLDGGTRADTVCIKQYGVVPSLECPAPYKAIRGSVETFTQFEIDTNIPLGDFAVATAYVGPTRDWIRSVQPEQGMLVVDTKPNPGEDVCKAVVNLSYVDGWEETFSANLYITQADKDDEFGREVSFADVRALATAEGTAVDEDILIEGIVVSDYRSPNMELNPNLNYYSVDLEENDRYQGAYLNRFLSSTFVPGSVFKTVTLTAALENLPDAESRTWNCTGSVQIGDETITCSGVHGEQTLKEAFAHSCNVAFAQIAEELGADTLKKYTEKAGLTSACSVDGLPTAQWEVQVLITETGYELLSW